MVYHSFLFIQHKTSVNRVDMTTETKQLIGPKPDGGFAGEG